MLLDNGQYTLLSGGLHVVEAIRRGFACKARKRSNRVYTERQLDFINWCYFEGVKGDHGGDPAKKYSADRAADEMRAYGTTAGVALHPTAAYWKLSSSTASNTAAPFCIRELMDHWLFKQWFSNTVQTFKTAINNARKKQVACIADLPENANVEDSDVDDE
jgi:hypothetical protein